MIGTVMNQEYKLKPTVSILETTQKKPHAQKFGDREREDIPDSKRH